jgi:hypothetical protein
MRILRLSHYAAPPYAGGTPMTVVLREPDMKTTLPEVIAGAMFPESLTLSDVFEIPGTPGIAQATNEAMRRLEAVADNEANMAILFHYDAAMLTTCNAKGTVINPAPAPLRREHIREVLMQLAQHPNYQPEQSVIVTSDHDYKQVRLVKGQIEEE